MYEADLSKIWAKEAGLAPEYVDSLLQKWLPPTSAPASVQLDAHKKASAAAVEHGLAWADATVLGKEAEAKSAHAHEALFSRIADLTLREAEIANHRKR